MQWQQWDCAAKNPEIPSLTKNVKQRQIETIQDITFTDWGVPHFTGYIYMYLSKLILGVYLIEMSQSAIHNIPEVHFPC